LIEAAHAIGAQLAQVSTGKLYGVQKYCALSNHCWSGYWIVANRRALSGLPADLLDIVNSHFDAAAIKERADLQEMDRSLQAELAGKGMTSTSPTLCNSGRRWSRRAFTRSGRTPTAPRPGRSWSSIPAG
jgi:TRAP-type C4-dicarboxylate transport system substrate-binding protein